MVVRTLGVGMTAVRFRLARLKVLVFTLGLPLRLRLRCEATGRGEATGGVGATRVQFPAVRQDKIEI